VVSVPVRRAVTSRRTLGGGVLRGMGASMRTPTRASVIRVLRTSCRRCKQVFPFGLPGRMMSTPQREGHPCFDARGPVTRLCSSVGGSRSSPASSLFWPSSSRHQPARSVLPPVRVVRLPWFPLAR
jgi:hypothetical protein